MKDTYTEILDDTGNLISKTDKENKITTYEHDAFNRLIKVTNQANETNATNETRVAGHP